MHFRTIDTPSYFYCCSIPDRGDLVENHTPLNLPLFPLFINLLHDLNFYDYPQRLLIKKIDYRIKLIIFIFWFPLLLQFNSQKNISSIHFHLIFQMVLKRFWNGFGLVLVTIFHSYVSKINAIYLLRYMAIILLISEW